MQKRKCLLGLLSLSLPLHLIISLGMHRSPLEWLSQLPKTAASVWYMTSSDDYYEAFLRKCAQAGVRSRLDNLNITNPKLTKIIFHEISADGQVLLRVQSYTNQNLPKSVGGDVLFVWAEQANGDGRVAGEVNDHQNGTYTGRITIPWVGMAKISVRIASFFENSCLKFHAMKKYGSGAFALKEPGGIKGTFSRGSVEEVTACGPQAFIYNSTDLCNFTKLNDGLSWYCGHPVSKVLNCSHISEFNAGPFLSKGDPQDKLLSPFIAILTDFVTINITQNLPLPVKECYRSSVKQSWRDTSGYHLNGRWHFFHCNSTFNNSVENYNVCLANKTLYFLGDSTVRQYGTYLLVRVLKKGGIDLMRMKGQNLVYHPNITVSNFGISVRFIKHAMPFHYPRLKPIGIKSLTTELENLAKSEIPDKQIIFLANIFAHFQAFRFSVFRDRTEKLVRAFAKFLTKKTGVKVFLRGPHFYTNSDARTYLIYKKIIFDLFSEFGLMDKVVYLDVWSISIAHGVVPLHPVGNALENQMTQFMSYIC